MTTVYKKSTRTALPGYPMTEQEKHLFFIAAELLNNVARHSKAQKAELTITYKPEQINLEIKDDGIGYEPVEKNEGVGISHIRARALLSGADFLISRRPSGGMYHRIFMPVNNSLVESNNNEIQPQHSTVIAP
ncbi:MAG: hypothetical protein JNJ57_00595, partial [Saprospiraceae bacterium]|nr:hypothetical protein [Saprospiraceae bacterium]